MTTQPQAAPGWYPDPEEPTKERYYDGNRWTDARRDGAPPPAPRQRERMSGLAIIGYINAVVIPLAGAIIGIIVGIRHQGPGKNHGPWIIGVSVIAFIVWTMIFLGAWSSETSSTYLDYGTTDYGTTDYGTTYP